MGVTLGKTSDGKRLALDVDRLITSRMLLNANSGAGKSWALRRVLEQTHGKAQQLVIDPEGEFYTLRSRFDYVLAGKGGGDCAAEPRSAHLLARRLLELGASAILDIYELKPPDRIRFVRRFLEALVDAPRTLWHPVLVVLDEAHVFAPQRGEAESAGAVIDLMSRGRKRGYAGVLATQRISKLHKDAAAEANNVLIGRAALDVDLKRACEELGFSGREDQQRVRRLKPGEFFAFGPALCDEVTLVHVGSVATEHPKAGARALPPPPPPRKVQAVLAQLADLPAEAEQETRTIASLEQQVRELRTELRNARAGKVEPNAQALDRARAEGAREAERALRGYVAQVQARDRRLAGAVERAMLELGKAADAVREPLDVELSTHEAPTRAPRANPLPIQEATAEPRVSGGLTRPQERILDSLAWLEAAGIEAPLRAVVGFLAEQSPRSSGFANNLGSMRTAGLIDYPAGGRVGLTEQGRALASSPDRAPTAEDLQARILEHLPAPQQRILRALIEVYPESLSRAELAERAGQSATSSGYANNLGALRNSWELIDYSPPGHVVGRPVLFLEGDE
jgi:hypothetical protein